MKNLLKLPLLLATVVAGALLTGCVASAGTVVSAGPPRPRYYRPAPVVVVRPAPVVVRPRAVIVHPGPRYYYGRPRSHRGWYR